VTLRATNSPLVYDQPAATTHLTERPNHTLSATALVHEAYSNSGPQDLPWQNRAASRNPGHGTHSHDHARAKAAAIRGGPEARRAAIALTSLPCPNSETENAGFLILADAIARLEGVDAESAQVVRLRYYAGLTIEQTAAAMGTSEPTVKRAWAFARAWLRNAVETDSF
jgi:RNA polymerase sigma factor (sigma-70 family)